MKQEDVTTCRNTAIGNFFRCSMCGLGHPTQLRFNYCPACGRRVEKPNERTARTAGMIKED